MWLEAEMDPGEGVGGGGHQAGREDACFLPLSAVACASLSPSVHPSLLRMLRSCDVLSSGSKAGKPRLGEGLGN